MDLELNTDYDFIVCNPPWLNASPLSLLDSGSFDKDEQFLIGAFKNT